MEVINLAGKYEKQLLKFLIVFRQVMEKGTSELTQNTEFISGGLTINNNNTPKKWHIMP